MEQTTAPKALPKGRSALHRRALAVITAGSLLNSFGFRIWQSLFNNFAVLQFAATADQIGLAQSIREIPGLFGFTVGLMALALSEIRIAGLSVVVMGIGIIMTGASDTYSALLISTLAMSAGFHVFVSSSQSVVLHVSDGDDAPRTLGRLSSLNAASAVVAAVIVLLVLDAVGFRSLFAVTGAMLVAGGLVLLPFSRQPERPARANRGWAVRRQYWLYYTLEFLLGSRRHIFSTFAIYLLVREHDVPAQTIAILFALNSLIGTFLFRRFGAIIARFGERTVLAVTLGLLVAVFLGYAFVPQLSVLYVLFFLDQILFGFSIATQSYFHKIALDPNDITPNMALGQSINHIAAVIVPVVGGIVWEAFGGQYTFVAGVVIVLATLLVVRKMRRKDEFSANSEQAHASA